MGRKYFPIPYQVMVILSIACLRSTQADCFVSMNGGLPDPKPLILLPVGYPDGFGFKLPAPGSTLTFAEGERVRLVCTGPDNFFPILDPKNDVIITCQDGIFNYNHDPIDFGSLRCSEDSRSETRRTSALCNNNNQDRVIEIGFQVRPNEFYSLISVCFDEQNLNSIWSKFDLVQSIRDGEVGLERPFFEPGPYYPFVDPNHRYTRPNQRNTIGRIVGTNIAHHYIPTRPKDTPLFLARGHLTASADFVYNVQKLSTYYYINAAPQWQSFNDGTWKELEIGARYYAHSRGVNLMVFTGTHGVATLPDEDGTEQELYLDYDEKTNTRRMAVPAVFWKVLYNPVDGLGIAFVGINNPYKSFEEVDNDDRYHVCERTIDVPYWGTCRAYQAQFQEKGFGYCCEVDDFRRFVTSLPEFDVTGVLA